MSSSVAFRFSAAALAAASWCTTPAQVAARPAVEAGGSVHTSASESNGNGIYCTGVKMPSTEEKEVLVGMKHSLERVQHGQGLGRADFGDELVLDERVEELPYFSAGPLLDDPLLWGGATVIYAWDEQTIAQTDLAASPETQAQWKGEMLEAMEWIAATTCVRFRERTRADIDTKALYVRLGRWDANQCWSYLGYSGWVAAYPDYFQPDEHGAYYQQFNSHQTVNPKQPSSLGGGCGVNTNIHELLHALGVSHEQSRPDRDAHIRILEENIDPEFVSQFAKLNYSVWDTKFDFNSIMLYHSKDFANAGTYSMVRKSDGKAFTDNRRDWGLGDIDFVNKLYRCPAHLIPALAQFDYTAAYEGLPQTYYRVFNVNAADAEKYKSDPTNKYRGMYNSPSAEVCAKACYAEASTCKAFSVAESVVGAELTLCFLMKSFNPKMVVYAGFLTHQYTRKLV